jgi:hypothetical protein
MARNIENARMNRNQRKFRGTSGGCKDGLIMLAELTAEPGYWRPSLDSDIFSPCVAGYSTLNAQDLANQRRVGDLGLKTWEK